jgi:hypothetical protein
MKRMITCSTLLLLTGLLFAQENKNGQHKPPPLTERWNRDNGIITYDIPLSADAIGKVKEVFYTFYTGMDALMEKATSAPPAREAVEKLVDKRNLAVLRMLSDEDAAKYLHVIPMLMPPPPPGHEGMPPHQGPPPPKQKPPVTE